MPMNNTLSPIKFTKMHGLGNDFVVIDAINQNVDISKYQMSLLSHRYLGIGFDQLLLIGPSTDADFSCRIYNADGSEAEQCGNGMRCVARFIAQENLSDKYHLTIETKAGIIPIEIKDYDNIRVTMGVPNFIQNSGAEFTALSIGNPHAILKVNAIEDVHVIEIGQKISRHQVFPQGANVGFVEIVNRDEIRLRTFERGVGETYACGSNACAAAAAGIQNRWLNNKVRVELVFGHLLIEWDGGQSPIVMTGPASYVYNGEFFI